jgi:hypothetical protein
MKRAIRILAIAPIWRASVAIARADSFAGSDWLFSLQGSLIVTGLISTTAAPECFQPAHYYQSIGPYQPRSADKLPSLYHRECASDLQRRYRLRSALDDEHHYSCRHYPGHKL